MLSLLTRSLTQRHFKEMGDGDDVVVAVVVEVPMNAMAMKKRIQLMIGVIASVLAIFIVHVQAQSPKAKNGTFALTNATIETVTKGTIQNGTIVLSGGKI